MLSLTRRAPLATALLIFVLPVVMTLPAAASPTRGDSAPGDVGAMQPRLLGDDLVLPAPLRDDPALPQHFSISSEPDRVLRQDFHIPPALSPAASEPSLSAALQPPTATRTPASNDTADPPREDLVVPIPAMGAGWALLIGAAMYQYGSRKLRLRR